ncbi:MAG: hypothetical protein ABL998_07175 [Planctomycetota bacterium]
MAWTLLACQFALELGFGVLLALAFVPRAPVGVLFYRLMGTTAALPIGAALWLRLRAGGEWTEPASLGALVALAGYPLYSGAVRGASWWVGLGLGLIGCGGAAAVVVGEGLADLGLFGQSVATLSALATGTVAGSVGLAMVLGHWYLTVPKLEIHYLQRLNRVTVAAMLASGGLFGLSLWLFSATLATSQPSLFDPFGLFYLGTRVAVGLALPLVFAAMAASSLRFKNTRSATGILYASTVLVLIGTAVSVFLQDSYRVPL